MKGKLIIILAVMAVLSNTALAYSGEVDFPELFEYNDEMNSNLETALNLISFSFNEKGVTVTPELLAAMMATLKQEVEVHKFLPKEEEGDYGMGSDSNWKVGGSRRSTPYEGGVDYKGRGYIQLTLKENYQKYCPDCVAKESNVCGCEKQWLCSVTDPAICPQIKALQPERAASIFASYYIKSPSGKNLVSLSNSEKYLEVAHAINVDKTYNSKFETYAKDYLTLFRNNPDKTKKLLTWLNSGSIVTVEAFSIGFPVTLTLYVHEGDINGPKIPGVLVTGQDGARHSFEQTTNNEGYVTITGDPGFWSFTISADGYETNSWNQEITETDAKDAFLQKFAAKPTIQAFQVTPLNVVPGEPVTIEYTVFDDDGSGLKQVELWRKDEQSDWGEIKRNGLEGNGPVSGSFTDAPSIPGKYWYGVHVVDNAGNWNDEKNSNSNNQPSVYEPIEVDVTEAQPVHSENSVVGRWLIFRGGGYKCINFRNDGTLDRSEWWVYPAAALENYKNFEGIIAGEWTQNGDNVRWQDGLSDYEATINGDTMSGYYYDSSGMHQHTFSADRIDMR
jgi:hypothetical protein